MQYKKLIWLLCCLFFIVEHSIIVFVDCLLLFFSPFKAIIHFLPQYFDLFIFFFFFSYLMWHDVKLFVNSDFVLRWKNTLTHAHINIRYGNVFFYVIIKFSFFCNSWCTFFCCFFSWIFKWHVELDDVVDLQWNSSVFMWLSCCECAMHIALCAFCAHAHCTLCINTCPICTVRAIRFSLLRIVLCHVKMCVCVLSCGVLCFVFIGLHSFHSICCLTTWTLTNRSLTSAVTSATFSLLESIFIFFG